MQTSGGPSMQAQSCNEGSGKKGDHQVVGCWDYLSYIRQFMGESGTMRAKERRHDGGDE